MKLKYVPEPTDPAWVLPPRYRTESVNNLLGWWQETTRKAGAVPPINVNTQRTKAELVVATIGYAEAMRTVAFMGTPQSRYFQYPWGIGAILRGHVELIKAQTAQPKCYSGWLGPVGIHNLGDKVNENEGKTRGEKGRLPRSLR